MQGYDQASSCLQHHHMLAGITADMLTGAKGCSISLFFTLVLLTVAYSTFTAVLAYCCLCLHCNLSL
jgi:hypothetical protein